MSRREYKRVLHGDLSLTVKEFRKHCHMRNGRLAYIVVIVKFSQVFFSFSFYFCCCCYHHLVNKDVYIIVLFKLHMQYILFQNTNHVINYDNNRNYYPVSGRNCLIS